MFRSSIVCFLKMMGKSSETIDKWRDYFASANSDIFGIIEHALMVAAMDYPQEFKMRRDGIAEILFTCKVTKCSGCNKVEMALPGGDEEDHDGKCKMAGLDRESGSKESKANDRRVQQMEMNVKQTSNYSYGDAEALTDEIEEETLTVGEVLRIKKVLDNYEDESESILFDSLRRLQLMGLSMETLKETEIGKSVKCLRKHGSKRISHLVQTLIKDWMVMVDEWVSATTALTESTPESGKTSTVVEEDEEEEGLPSPPLDEGAFFTTASMELSQFFDGMDFDGNPQNSGEFKNRYIPPFRKQQLNGRAPNAAPRDLKNEPLKKQEEVVMKKQASESKPNKHSSSSSSSIVEQKSQQKVDKSKLQNRAVAPQQNNFKTTDDDSVQKKLEVTKRKLQERYQEAANAKKQRTIQVMELHDIPKQGHAVHKNQHAKAGNHSSRHNGR